MHNRKFGGGVLDRYNRFAKLRNIEFIDNPIFNENGADALIMASMPGEDEFMAKMNLPAVTDPVTGQSTRKHPLLTKEQEQHLFRKLNYSKFMYNKLRPRLTITTSALDQIERYYFTYNRIIDLIVESNQRLIIGFARQLSANTSFGKHDFDTLLSTANFTLLKTIHKFDFSFNFKFSTYATTSIKRAWLRPDLKPSRANSLESEDWGNIQARDVLRNDEEIEREQLQADRLKATIEVMYKLTDRERLVLNWCFGTAIGLKRRVASIRTLREIGEEIGVTGSAAQAIRDRALAKLRQRLVQAS